MAEPGDPAERGRLHVQGRVVERIGERAALEVAGVVRHASGLERLTRRDFPRVAATVAGRRVRVAVELAVCWPHPAAQAAAEVRERVRDRLTALAGLHVDAVDVTVGAVALATDGAPGRRVE